jgi:2'-hydroxyisoflavone reductase
MDHTDHYIFISSIAVYENFQEVGLHEKSEVVSLPSNKDEWGYAEEKLAAESFIIERFKNNHTILRPGPIKGWRDPALDLLYWCVKLNRDDSIIAPGSGMDPLQFIDVKDVGMFATMAFENELLGIYNCTGPTKMQLLWRDFLTLSKKHFNSNTKLIWAEEEFLKENQVYSFSDLPLWAPLSEDKGFMQISNKKLIQSGFQFTPITSTLDDCMKWYSEHMDHNIKFGTSVYDIGLEKSRELNLIEKLKEQIPRHVKAA